MEETSSALTRRTLLAASAAAGGLALLAACTSSPPDPRDPDAPTPTGQDDPDFALRESVATAEARLIAAYDATIKAHPDARELLAPFRAQHAAHLAAVTVPAGVPAPKASAPSVPDSQAAALTALAAAEERAASARAKDCVAAQRWQLARELSLIGGCEAAHHALIKAEVG